MTPISKINEWLRIEKDLGSLNPDRVVLATASKNGIPRSRIVAIREINDEGILFFTQKGTKKVGELTVNPAASMTLWLALQQRQVVLNGLIKKLSPDENQFYWNTMPRDRQLRFSAYAPTSSQPIHSLKIIENKLKELTEKFQGIDVPMSEYYCGFKLIPETLLFYTLGVENFSEIKQFSVVDNEWQEEMLSP